MATGSLSRPNFPSRPAANPFAAAAPPVASPFVVSSPVVTNRPDGLSVRPPPVSGPTSTPLSSTGHFTRSLTPPPFRPSPPAATLAPPLPAPSQGLPTLNHFHGFPAPQQSMPPQTPLTQPPPVGLPNMVRPPAMCPPIQLPGVPGPLPPVTYGPPLVGLPNMVRPPVMGPPIQRPSVPGPPTPVTFGPPPQTLPAQFPPPPQSYAQSRPAQPPSYHTGPPMHGREHMQQPFAGPPAGSMKDLVEDFSSLSLGIVPGSLDSELDLKALPRPLEGDVEPKALTETYPLNCNPKFLRFTTSAMPHSQSLALRWHLPLGAVVCPLAETSETEEVPVVNYGSKIRCRRCQSYLNPYITFTDSGRKWRCNLCALLNNVPDEYFAQLDGIGRRIDIAQRPELSRGSVDFVASTDQTMSPPMPPVYFFLIDVSISAVRSGMLEAVAQTIKSCLDKLPGFPRTQIGFITFDSTIHFYNMKSTLSQPQMMVVADIDDVFVPLPDDLLVNLSESRSVVESFLDTLPSMFQDSTDVESAFGPALRAAYMVMRRLGGKLLIFQNSLPSIGVGRLILRGEDHQVYGTDKEHSLRVAEDIFYKQMAADFTKHRIGVNVYAFSDKYTDVASLGTLSKYTGGQLNFYPSFKSVNQKEKLRHELARDLTRETAWEAVMRVRCAKGIRISSYHGNFMLMSPTLLSLPAVDCDKAFAMQFCLEETLLTTDTVYFQVALLYTASCGERRVRVHTAAVPVVADLGEMYRQADTGAIVSVLGRLAIERSLHSKLDDARTYLHKTTVKALKEYRNLHAVQHRLTGRMIYPESLKYLPLYVLALCKSTPLRGGYADVQLDERCAVGSILMTLPVKNLLKFLYPSLIRVDEFLLKASSPTADFENAEKSMPHLPLTAESLDLGGLYIFDDGLRFIIWIGGMLPPKVARSLNVDDPSDLSQVNLCESEHDMSRRLMGLLNKLRESNPPFYQHCHFVRQGEQCREGLHFLANLIEDKADGTSEYADWIMRIHRPVQQNC